MPTHNIPKWGATIPEWGAFLATLKRRLHAVSDAPTVAAAELDRCPPGALTLLAELLDRLDDLEEKLALLEVRG